MAAAAAEIVVSWHLRQCAHCFNKCIHTDTHTHTTCTCTRSLTHTHKHTHTRTCIHTNCIQLVPRLLRVHCNFEIFSNNNNNSCWQCCCCCCCCCYCCRCCWACLKQRAAHTLCLCLLHLMMPFPLPLHAVHCCRLLVGIPCTAKGRRMGYGAIRFTL